MTASPPATPLEWARWARKQRVGAPLKPVLMVLASFVNGEGWCWPSKAEMADALEISPSTLRRKILLLETLGVVRVEARFGMDGARKGNRYGLVARPDQAERVLPVHSSATGSVQSFGPYPVSQLCNGPRSNKAPPLEESSKGQEKSLSQGGLLLEDEEALWRLFTSSYPSNKQDRDTTAKRAWDRLEPNEKAAAARGAKAFVQSFRDSGLTHCCHRATYLSDRLWKVAEVVKPESTTSADKWNRVMAAYRGEPFGEVLSSLPLLVGPDVCVSWFSSLHLEGLDRLHAKLSVPTKFLKKYVDTHFEKQLRVALARIGATSFAIEVRSSKDGAVRMPGTALAGAR